MKHLNIFLPEWQGYAESRSLTDGANELKSILEQDFHTIQVVESRYGEIKENIKEYDGNMAHLEQFAKLLRSEQPDSTFLVAGTCASEIAPVTYHNEKNEGNIAVLWFDGHADLNTPDSSPSKHFHGMPLRAILGDSDQKVLDQSFRKLDPRQVFLVGTRDFDEPENEYIRENSINVITVAELEDPNFLVDRLKSLGFNNIYVHVDLDVLEPAEFPHLLFKVPNGLGVQALINQIKFLKKELNVVGSSLVEFVPANETALNQVKPILQALMGNN